MFFAFMLMLSTITIIIVGTAIVLIPIVLIPIVVRITAIIMLFLFTTVIRGIEVSIVLIRIGANADRESSAEISVSNTGGDLCRSRS